MKKVISLLLCLSLLCVPLTAAGAGGVPGWAAEAYTALQARSLISQNHPQAAGEISRGEFAGLLAESVRSVVPTMGLEAVSLPERDYFADAVYDQSALRAAAFGILEGRVENGLRYADADSPLTREQAAKMVCACLDFFGGLGYEVTAGGSPALYNDAASISAWAAPYTGRVASYGIIQGDQNGNFTPQGSLDWPSAVVVLARTLALLDAAAASNAPGLALESALDWSWSFGAPDYQAAKPYTGYALGYYAIDNGDGTLSALVAPPVQREYDAGAEWVEVLSESFYVERYDAGGKVVESRTLPMELPIWGGFLDGGDCFYVAFGQENMDEDDGREVFRIVQYDRDWNRLAAASVTGGKSYTCAPYEAAVPRMAVSDSGTELTLHAARLRYANQDGVRHQSNITIVVDTGEMRVKSVSEPFPDNHVSHSFGQFVQYDGGKAVTVDHGDAYPRSFVLQTGGGQKDLLELAGATGENVTNAIGSGFEVSDSSYLFLGCSDPQAGGGGQPWNVFLTVTDKSGLSTRLTWLTDSDESIDCARLVKVDEDTFVAMWGQAGGLGYQVLDGRGHPVGGQQTASVPMPPTQPVVQDGAIRWIQTLGYANAATAWQVPCIFTVELD